MRLSVRCSISYILCDPRSSVSKKTKTKMKRNTCKWLMCALKQSLLSHRNKLYCNVRCLLELCKWLFYFDHKTSVDPFDVNRLRQLIYAFLTTLPIEWSSYCSVVQPLQWSFPPDLESETLLPYIETRTVSHHARTLYLLINQAAISIMQSSEIIDVKPEMLIVC